MGSFYLVFSDAIREGDGLRILRYWKYLIPLFKSSNRKKYSIEVLNMLNQYEYMLTPRLSQELLWSRFVNTHSIPGRNIPCDLFQEHLNRVCKEAVRGLRANKTEKAITKIGKTLGTVVPVLDNYDTENGVTHVSGAHKVPSSGKDVNMIIEHLLKKKIFSINQGRCHSCFSTPRDVLHVLDKDTLMKWIIDHI